MPTRFTVVCDDALASEVESLAREYGLTEEEVLQQLIDLGLDETHGARDRTRPDSSG